MKVSTHGTGKPSVAIVGGVHGDEPRTAEVVEDLNTIFETSQMSKHIHGTIKLIIANEPALSQDVRYTETDLNRAFLGDEESELYEERLATELLEVLKDCDAVLGLHSTHSAPPPFAITSNMNKEVNRKTLLSSPVDYVLDTSDLRQTTMDTHVPQTVTIEIGEQGTEKARNFGYEASLSVLRGHGVIDDKEHECTPKRIAKGIKELEKGSGEPELYSENFEELEKGDVIAEDDEVRHVAEEDDLTPTLASEKGYEDIFGILSKFDGHLSDV